MITRRNALKTAALGSLAITAAHPGSVLAQPTDKAFQLRPLPYPTDALEPHIDARTMEIHHGKHHAAYVTNLNKALAEVPEAAGKSMVQLTRDVNSLPEKVRPAIKNNLGGHYNHSLFWMSLSKNGGQPKGELEKAIERDFGNIDGFREQFTKAAISVFGSGWAWLSLFQGKLSIETTPNQNNPWMEGRHPVLGLDVWEHAYYLKYQNRRPEYIAAFFNVINWDFVASRFIEGGKI
ncbi:MAG: superoxide dismutase [Verrucomicrobiota bacterium]|nr:superoxide dismutase [Verrucomicrobiota bacterium]